MKRADRNKKYIVVVNSVGSYIGVVWLSKPNQLYKSTVLILALFQIHYHNKLLVLIGWFHFVATDPITYLPP